MKKYMITRIIQLIPILFGITILAFLLINTGNTDVVDVMETSRGTAMTEEEKDALREQLGLDEPLPVQYMDWMKGALTGNMGTSMVSGKPVRQIFRQKLPATIELAAISLLLTIVVSIPLGVLAAVKKGSLTDHIICGIGFIGNSMPNFFVGLLLLYFFALKLGWFPVIAGSGNRTGVVLPAVTLAIAMVSKYTRQVRAAVLEEWNQDYVTGARARGVGEGRILIFQVLRKAMLTMITLFALSAGSLLGGTAVVETIFQWDGVGKMAVDAITMRDYPVILAYVVWMAVIYVILNLFADLLYALLNPKIRRG